MKVGPIDKISNENLAQFSDRDLRSVQRQFTQFQTANIFKMFVTIFVGQIGDLKLLVDQHAQTADAEEQTTTEPDALDLHLFYLGRQISGS